MKIAVGGWGFPAEVISIFTTKKCDPAQAVITLADKGIAPENDAVGCALDGVSKYLGHVKGAIMDKDRIKAGLSPIGGNGPPGTTTVRCDIDKVQPIDIDMAVK